GVGGAVQFAGNLQGDGSGEEPQVPPAVVAEDQAADGGRVLQDQPGGGALGGDVEGGGGSERIAGEEDRFAVVDFGDVIVDGQGGGRDRAQLSAAVAAAVAGVIYHP